jgi:REP element-mobilizing transposase RayT
LPVSPASACWLHGRTDSAHHLLDGGHFDAERYRLWAWCVMSNHVHVVAQQMEGWESSRVVHGWKSFTANRINRIHGRVGPVWIREYFDRYMRDDDHLWTTIEYVENNPVAAKLVAVAVDWPWSSARLRTKR